MKNEFNYYISLLQPNNKIRLLYESYNKIDPVT